MNRNSVFVQIIQRSSKKSLYYIQCIGCLLMLQAMIVITSIVPATSQNLGFSQKSIFFGQSAAFSGTAAELGKGMQLGIEAAFNESNIDGGIHGRKIYLRYLDDGYEPSQSIKNTRKLIDEFGVFALIGAVGTPTSRAAVQIVEKTNIPYIAPLTGAGFLRDPEKFKTVINIRASYQQEVSEMIERLTQDRGITRIAVLYQDDSFGRVGFDATKTALAIYGMDIVARGTYPRNTKAVKTALYDIKQANPDAVIVVGAYEPVAHAIKWAHKIDFNPIFMTISFVGSNALAQALGDAIIKDVFMTQVVPYFLSNDVESAAGKYNIAVNQMWPGAELGYISFEGYLAGRLTIKALEMCGPDLTRECFLDLFHKRIQFSVGDIDLVFGEYDNQGLDDVYLTAYDPEVGFVPVRSLNDDIKRR